MTACNPRRARISVLYFCVCIAALSNRAAVTPADAQATIAAATAGRASHFIRLRARTIDTQPAVALFARSGITLDKMTPEVAQWAKAATTTEHAVIVQFTDAIGAPARTAVAACGAEVYGYLPDNALLLGVTPAQLRALAALPAVQYLGAYAAADKLEPALAAACAAAPVDAREVTIVTCAARTTAAVAAAVQALGGQVRSTARGPRKGTLRARLDARAIAALAARPDVEWIERAAAPRWWNDVSARGPLMDVAPVWTNQHLTGRGQVIAVCDTGLDTGDPATMHPDFTNRIYAAFSLARTNDWSDLMGHGTHVAGSVLGNGSAWSNGLYKGMAYEAQLVMQACGDESDNIYLPEDLNTLFIQAYTNAARIHSDSWGDEDAGRYAVESRMADEFVWNHPDMLIVFAAGNEGIDANHDGVIDLVSVGSPGTAKNVLTVGAAISDRPVGSGGYADNAWGDSWPISYPTQPVFDGLTGTPWDGRHQGLGAFSSRGPCLDGRIKPDVVAPGANIVSCRSHMPKASVLWGTGTGVLDNDASNDYTFCGGTSMATPLTAGAAGLVRQYLNERQGLTNPSAALIKALMAAGARTLFPGQYGTARFQEIPSNARPNPNEGWGHVALADTLFPGAQSTNILRDGQTVTTDALVSNTFVSSGSNQVSVVLAWSDYPAVEAAQRTLVNDLDLLIVTPGGRVLYPNGLAGFDRTNNTEGIDIYPTESGIYTILVYGYNVPQGPQPCALVVHERALLAQTIDSLAHQPRLVSNMQPAQVQAIVRPNASGIASATNFYRANGGPWLSAPVGVAQFVVNNGIITSAVPGHAVGTIVDYFTSVYAHDGAVAISVTNTYTVKSPVIYVAGAGTQTAPYDAWHNAFKSFTGALAYIQDDMTVVLTNGIYTETPFVLTNAIIVRSAHGPRGTVLDGQHQRPGVQMTAAAVLDGFTITRGLGADFHGGNKGGGGAYLEHGLIRNCLITGNYALTGGGVMALFDSVLSNCVINHNVASNSTGGASIALGAALLDSSISENVAQEGMGGINVVFGGLISNCLISGNIAGGVSGAVGGVALMFGAEMNQCTIVSNRATTMAGGVLSLILMLFPGEYSGGPTLRNCLIMDNDCGDGIGGGLVIYGHSYVHNCTIVRNHAETSAGFHAAGGGSFYNTIAYGNGPGSNTMQKLEVYNIPMLVDHCCIDKLDVDDSVDTSTVITNDPVFADVAVADFRLTAGSPCRDTGTNLAWMSAAVDLDGNPRILNRIVDMGAYEFVPEPGLLLAPLALVLWWRGRGARP